MKTTRPLLDSLSKFVDYYSRFNPSPLSIKQFIDFGRKKCEKTSFVFLRKELAVRLANIMQEINLLPENLLRMPSVALVQSWYRMSFEEVLKFGKADENDIKVLEQFCENLIRIRNRHSAVVQTMANGVLELKETHRVEHHTEHSIQYFLNRFYMSRISIRMLINQHAMLFGSDMPSHPRHIGCVDPNCDVAAVIRDAFENAKFLCDQYYLASPGLRLEQFNTPQPGAPISIVYVPSHLYHILFELFKNSMRAVVENYSTETETLPSINVLLVKGKEDITIKMSDLGGGIKRSLSHLLFQYMYSTAPRPSVSGINSAPLAGYGYGLPLSRLYARYFHGDLIVNSYEGYGTDALVYLKVMSSEANELLPVFNKTSTKHYKAVIGSHDWSSSVVSTPNNSQNKASPTSTEQPLGISH